MRPTNVRWGVIALLSFAATINYLDRANLSGGTTFVGFLSLELLSLLVAVASLTLLIRRVRAASSAAKG